MTYFLNRILQKLSIWSLKRSSSNSKKEKSKLSKNLATLIARGDEGGDFTVYFMTDEHGKVIVQSILIHCNKYDEGKMIATSYVLKCWDYAMDGARLWEINGCNMDTALDIPHKLVIDYEIKQIVSGAYKTLN
jgi:hypothetical protein